MNKIKRYLVLLPLVFLSVTAAPGLHAAEDAVGRVVSSYGQVYVSSGQGNEWQSVGRGQYLYAGNTIKTLGYSGASLRMEDESLMRLSADTTFEIEAVRITSFWRKASAFVNRANRGITSSYRLLSGKIWGRNNNRDVNASIITTTATIGIRGTEYVIQADQNSSSVSLQEGAVLAENEYGSVSISSGEQVVILTGSAPEKSRLIQTGESVQWTVFVPELITLDALLTNSGFDSDEIQGIQQAYLAGQYVDAIKILSTSSRAGSLNSRMAINWLKLKVGESAAAYHSLGFLADQDRSNVTLRELLAFSAFINGEINQAKEIIKVLRQSKELSDTGWIINGYINQSDYRLAEAVQSFSQAVDTNPDNNLAKILLSRIYFGSEQTAKAQSLVDLILRKEPEHRLALNLKGFILLSSNQTVQAVELWEQLLNASQPDAESFFGLSLAMMRLGRVEEAMQHIATAVLLDPQRAMYLSYWGKMLHQIGRYDKALTVLDSAIRLDPQDPTPQLYKAIILRDLNRPGEAIALIQSAKKLNDNKGVYRSRSLLDKDSAVQNVDLSRIYTQLGLSNWAHKQAMESIKQDFTNASAHILNAGAYSEQPDRAYALGSEALLARMLQHANQNAFNTYNGYTSLFDAPDTEFDLVLGAGNHAQQELFFVGVGALPEKQLAWSVAGFHASDDGWRDTNGETAESLSLLTKWQPSQQNNIMFSLSATNFERLDNFFSRYEIDSVSKTFAEYDQTALKLEFGITHRIDQSHDFMTYMTWQDDDIEITSNETKGQTVFNGETLTLEEIYNGDFSRPYALVNLQGVKRIDNHQLFYGLVAYAGENYASKDNLSAGFYDSSFALVSSLTPAIGKTYDLDISYTGIYLQDSWQMNSFLSVDLAGYVEKLENSNAVTGGEWVQDETTARAGMAWKITDRHTLRIAAFKYLLPFITARLDPTDVAGIPIYKNTSEGSLVTEYDVMWDYEWDKGLLSVNLFKLEESFKSADASQVVTITEGEKEGAIVDLDLLAGLQAGVKLSAAHFTVKDESNAALDRAESSAVLQLTHVTTRGLRISLQQVFRQIDFDTGNQSEDIDVTNLTVSYEFAHKTQSVELVASNIFDNEFNWVTDKFSTSGIAPERLIKLAWQVRF